MSRSYKKNPWVTDHHRKSTKISKKFANKYFRNQIKSDKHMSNKPNHKKYYCSWDICDFRWMWTEKEAREDYENGKLSRYIYKQYPTIEDWLNYWAKCCKRK